MTIAVIPPELGKGGAYLTDQTAEGLKSILEAIIAAVDNNDRILRNNAITITTTTSTSSTSSSTSSTTN